MNKINMLEEWSLFDHVFFLISRWYLVLGVTVFFSSVAVMIALGGSPKVSGEGVLQIGSVVTLGTVEDPREVVARISSMSFKQNLMREHPDKVPQKMKRFELKSYSIGSTGLVKILSVANSEETAKNIIQLAARKVTEDHAVKFEAKNKIFQTKYQALKKQVEFLSQQINAQQSKDKDSASLMFFTIEKSRQWERLGSLQKELANYEAGLSPVLLRKTELVSEPGTLIVSSRRKIVALGFFAGFLLSIVLCYLLEFRRQRKKAVSGGEV